jgi:glutamyl-tRNA reductase
MGDGRADGGPCCESQVKQCYTHGIDETGYGGKVVSRLLNSAVCAGKRVRSETGKTDHIHIISLPQERSRLTSVGCCARVVAGISKGAVSISSAAVEFTDHKCPKDLGKEFDQSSVAIIGAGKMSRLLMIHMASQGIERVTLLNRGRERAEQLAAEFPEMKVDIKLMDELWPVMHSHDVVYTSTSASGCIVTKEGMLANGVTSPTMLVDISVPRNVETEVGELEGQFAYNVDHLKEVVDRNTAMRKKQMLEVRRTSLFPTLTVWQWRDDFCVCVDPSQAEDLLMEELEKFRSWQFSLGAIPAIARLQEKAEAMRLEEMKKATKKLNKLSDKELETVERLTKGASRLHDHDDEAHRTRPSPVVPLRSAGIVNKLLHGPMTHMRATENLEKNLVALKTLKAVFEL